MPFNKAIHLKWLVNAYSLACAVGSFAQTGIAAALSTTAGGGSPQTVYDQTSTATGTDDSNGDANVTFRVSLPASTLSAPTGSPTQFRVSFMWGASCPTEAGALQAMYAGQAAASGDQYDFLNAPTHVTFAGAGTANASAGGVVVSDWVSLPEAFDATKIFNVAFYINTGSSAHLTEFIVGTSQSNFKSGNDAATQNATGYTFIGGSPIFGISKIEVR